jgi:hypothetical protein
MTGRPLAALLLAALTAGPLLAQDPKEPKLPDAAAFDKLVVDALRDVHNRGADLYNTKKEYEAAYRMYQGALVAVRPLLGHRPAAQKIIDEGLAAAEKEGVVAIRAFKLHEAIEDVRSYLKDPTAKKNPDPKPKDPKDPKPKDPIDPKPKDVTKPKDPGAGAAGSVSGKVTFKGQPLAAAEVTVVTLDEAKPRVFTAPIQTDGSYSFKEPLPPGRYVVIVTATAVPAKYATTTTSGLTIDVKPGANSQNIELK